MQNRRIMPEWLAGLWAGRYRTVGEFFEALRSQRRERELGGGDTVVSRFINGAPEDGPHWIAPQRLRRGKEYFYSDQYLGQALRANWAGVDEQIQLFAAGLIREARKAGIPLFAHNARRTEAEQRELYRKGRSKLPGPEAPHVRGGAVDIVHSAFFWEMSEKEWALIGKMGKDVADRLQIPIEWGGDWRFWDPAHWQLYEWRFLEEPEHAGLPPIHQTPVKLWNRLKPR